MVVCALNVNVSLLGELVSEGLNLGARCVVERTQDGHLILRQRDVLHTLELLGHNLGSRGRPGTGLDERHGAVLVGMLGERMDEGAHEREDLALISDGGEHQAVVAERVLNGLGHVVASQVKDGDLLAASLECCGELLDGAFRWPYTLA